MEVTGWISASISSRWSPEENGDEDDFLDEEEEEVTGKIEPKPEPEELDDSPMYALAVATASRNVSASGRPRSSGAGTRRKRKEPPSPTEEPPSPTVKELIQQAKSKKTFCSHRKQQGAQQGMMQSVSCYFCN